MITAFFPSHSSNPRPWASPEFPTGRVPADKHHLPPLATKLTPSQVPARPLCGLSDPSALQNYGSLRRKQGCVATATHSRPHQLPSSPQPVSGLSPPQTRPPSLTRSPPPMTVETFPHYLDLEDSGRIERKRREIAQVRPPQMGSRRTPAATFTARPGAHFRENVL